MNLVFGDSGEADFAVDGERDGESDDEKQEKWQSPDRAAKDIGKSLLRRDKDVSCALELAKGLL